MKILVMGAGAVGAYFAARGSPLPAWIRYTP